VAADPKYAAAKARLRADLDRWLRQTADPRATSDDDRWDHYPYYGPDWTKRKPRPGGPGARSP